MVGYREITAEQADDLWEAGITVEWDLGEDQAVGVAGGSIRWIPYIHNPLFDPRPRRKPSHFLGKDTKWRVAVDESQDL